MTGLRTKQLVLLACVAALAVPAGACGESDEEERVREAREEGEREGRNEQRLKQLERELKERKSGGGSGGNSGGSGSTGGTSPPPSTGGGTNCGGVTAVTSATSCEFARAVKNTYQDTGGSSVLRVYSSVTKKSYTMNCTSGSPHRCSGGNNAVVTFP